MVPKHRDLRCFFGGWGVGGKHRQVLGAKHVSNPGSVIKQLIPFHYDWFCRPQLKMLSLRGNELVSLPASVGQLQNLEKLYLGD